MTPWRGALALVLVFLAFGAAGTLDAEVEVRCYEDGSCDDGTCLPGAPCDEPCPLDGAYADDGAWEGFCVER